MPDTEPLRDETEEEEAAESNESQSDDEHWKAPIVVCRSVIDLGIHGRRGDLCGRKGQRREPATGSVRIATRRAGWRPFAGPGGSTSFSSNRRRGGCSRLPMKAVISLFSTGWQDGQDAFGSRRGPYSSCHSVILSESTIESPVLDLGFWVVERPKLSNPARGMQ
jgi:hypothetical protein